MNLLIKAAHIIDSNSPFNGKTLDILIEDGVITSVAKNIDKKGVTVFEANDLCVSPGWFDLQVNIGDPGFEYKEDIESACKAATAGGFTGMACTPKTNPVTHSKAQIEYIINSVKNLRKNAVDVFPIGALSNKMEGNDLAELFDMHQSGAIAFTDLKNTNNNAGLLLRGLQYVKTFDGLIIVFCDDKTISASGQMNESTTSTALGLKGIPALAEELMVARNISIAEYTDAKIHLAGISTAKSVELIRKAKARKINVTASVNAYNIVMDDSLLKSFDTNYKVNPPLRSKADCEALKKGLIDGTIDCITSDHTPENIENKNVEFDFAAEGMIGLETMFGMLSNKLETNVLIEKIAINPRKILGLEIPSIHENTKANLTLFNTTEEWVVEAKNLKSKSKNTPLIGQQLKGKALRIIN